MFYILELIIMKIIPNYPTIVAHLVVASRETKKRERIATEINGNRQKEMKYLHIQVFYYYIG
jgi:hypothetical protein